MAKARKYKKVGCHRTKRAAKAAQKTLHGKGFTAKIDANNCVWSAGKKKKKK